MLKQAGFVVVLILLSLSALFLPSMAQAKKLNVVTATTDLDAGISALVNERGKPANLELQADDD